MPVSFPKFEDWQAPWEKKGTEFNAETAKGLIYSLSKEAAEVKEKHDTALASVTQERDTLKTKVEEAETKDLSEVERLKRENERLKETQAKKGEPNLDLTRLELALEHGLTKAQAKRLVGGTVDELTADAKAYAEEVGASGQGSLGGKPPQQRPDAKGLRSGLGDDGDTEGLDPKGALQLLPPRR